MQNLDPTVYAGPLVVTLAFVLLYYGTMLNIMRVKARLGRAYKARDEKFDRYFGQDREMLAADRIQLNLLEHMPPFFVLLWLTALFVGPDWATYGGAVYVAARGLYPFLVGGRLGRGIRAKVLVSTFTGYAVLVYFMGTLVWSLAR